jgi:hypothetical protein
VDVSRNDALTLIREVFDPKGQNETLGKVLDALMEPEQSTAAESVTLRRFLAERGIDTDAVLDQPIGWSPPPGSRSSDTRVTISGLIYSEGYAEIVLQVPSP